jgi:hypothetical protein
MTANGDSHLDFELLRCVDYSGAAIGANTYLSHPAGNINSAVMFCGPDSGHTAGITVPLPVMLYSPAMCL